jgi:hypothetical protein
VTLAEAIGELAATVGPPDRILATSLVDVAGLRGMLPPELRGTPIALYMHENQITYPAISRTRTERNYGLINWTSLLAADSVAFNSEFHRTELLAALPAFLREFPDERHGERVVDVATSSLVLPVGCDLRPVDIGTKSEPPLIAWNHRWDPDKDPGAFLRIVTHAASAGLDFEVALLGERFVNQHHEFDDQIAALGTRVVVDDHLDRTGYLEVLGRTSLVVSTALQEFFGISVVEAMAAGAFPILPDRLVYPERVPRELADRVLYRSEADAVDRIATALNDLEATHRLGASLAADVGRFDWSEVAPTYDAWLESTAAS